MITLQRPDPDTLMQALRMRLKLTPLDARYVTEVFSVMFETVCLQAEHHLRALEERIKKLEAAG